MKVINHYKWGECWCNIVDPKESNKIIEKEIKNMLNNDITAKINSLNEYHPLKLGNYQPNLKPMEIPSYNKFEDTISYTKYNTYIRHIINDKSKLKFDKKIPNKCPHCNKHISNPYTMVYHYTVECKNKNITKIKNKFWDNAC